MKTILAAAGLIGAAGLLAGWTTLGDTTGETNATDTATSISASAESFEVDRVHSSVVFKIRHVGASNFYGRFNSVSGSLSFDEAGGTIADVSIEIPVESVDTNNPGRDDHVRGGDFFNVGQYPTASFASTGFEPNGDGGGTLTGDLTLHGVTRTVTADVRDFGTGEMRGTRKMGFEATFTIKRGDFGITTYLADDGSDNGPLGNTVTLTVAIEANAG